MDVNDCSKRFKRSEEDGGSVSVEGASDNLKHNPSVEEVYEKDLPLMSNVEDIHVSHYLLKLEFCPLERIVKGIAILYTKKVQADADADFIVLDCCALDVHSVRRVCVDSLSVDDPKELHQVFACENTYDILNFTVDKWSLKIWGWEREVFPQFIRIDYTTAVTTPSLHWRPSWGFEYNQRVDASDNFNCCYTPAAPVNNRGLFPCQEPPSAMATWQCFVKCPHPYRAFLSSDSIALIVERNDHFTVTYYNCSQELPMSTFSVVVSVYDESNIITDTCLLENNVTIPVRWIFQTPVDTKMIQNIVAFTKSAIIESTKLLGTLPFPRMDLVVMPQCFPTLGLANPCMIMLSPTVLSGNAPLIYSRIAHEICHFWFGLSIGALDWTEEWLSEGFATFMEDVVYENVRIHCSQCQVFLGDSSNEIQLRPLVRLMTLQNELNNTSTQEELHFLQPNKIPEVSQHRVDEGSKNYLINGLEPMKEFMQVHYLKGYFCLKLLSDLVGNENFMTFLRSYVDEYRGRLVTTDDFLQEFIKFGTLSGLHEQKKLVMEIAESWLRRSELPVRYSSLKLNNPTLAVTAFTDTFPSCAVIFQTISNLTSVLIKCRHRGFPSSPDLIADALRLDSSQKLVLLEQLVSSSAKFKEVFLKQLAETLQLDNENPEVLHRWCELIIKSKCKSRLQTVKNYLLSHPAMGVYLYGELMISEKRSFQKLAREVFKLRETVLDPPVLKILKVMIS